jgi:GNAT superfamily N-acetyltransferase
MLNKYTLYCMIIRIDKGVAAMSLPLKQLEELSLQQWPALITDDMDGWALRMANGYTKRANCISTLHYTRKVTAQNTLANIASCEYKYTAIKQPTIFKITPFSEPQLDDLLAQLDYELVDPSLVLTLQLEQFVHHAPTMKQSHAKELTFTIDEHISLCWLEQYCQLTGVNPRFIPTMIDMIAAMPGQVLLARCLLNDEVVALAMAVIDQGIVGLYDVVTADSYRNLGLCSYLLSHLLLQCKQQGARYSYLAVVESNETAKHVYSKLGYQLAYRYWYRIKQ